MSEVIKVENLSKQYRLGTVGTGTLVHDVNRWWHKMRGKEDPYLMISETNDRSKKGISDYVWSLKGVNFSIEHGDIVGIIGRNGAGKSTLLKILSRTTSPTTGSVKIKGRVTSLLEVGTGFHPELTGRENIFLNGAILGMTKKEIKRRFDEIVDFSGVERYIDTPVKRYSSGMYVRLAFAVAAHLESEILIVDEVLAVGDVEFQNKCLSKMGDVSKGEGRTVLFVSHNLSAIRSLCKKAILLGDGKIIKNDETDTVVNSYIRLDFKKQNSGLIEFDEPVTNGIMIKKIWLSDSSGSECQQSFDIDSPFKVNFLFYLQKRISRLHLAFCINNSIGEPVYFIDRRDYSKEFIGLDEGVYSSSIDIQLPLLIPGQYYFDICVLDYDNQVSDIKENILSFDIVDTKAARQEKRAGFIYFPTTWTIDKI
jgi:lipopolysaccharide transport system ATP-binding protein